MKRLLAAATVMGLGAAVTSGAAGAAQGVAAPAGPAISVWSGVYTEAQAKRGEAVATQHCTACHGSGLRSGDAGPTLVGPEFLSNWKETTAADLSDQIQRLMPSDTPGVLTPQENADIVAFLFQLNQFPAGENELPADMTLLKAIKIEIPPPAK